MIDAPRDRVWDAGLRSAPSAAVVAARACGSRTSASAPGGRRSRWTTVLGTAAREGRPGGLPLQRRDGGRALRVGAGDRGDAVREDPALRGARDPARGREREHAVTLASSERLRGLSRLGSPMMRRATRQRLDEALDGIERAADSEQRSRADSPMKWWGWGDPASGRELGAEALATLRAELGAGRAGASASALEEVALPAAAPVPEAIADAVGSDAVLDRHEHRVRGPPGRGYPDLVRLRSGRLDDAPDAVVLPGSAAEVGARARGLRARSASRSSRSAAARASSAASTRLPGRFERLISLDLGRLRRRERGPSLADRDPRPRPARARGRGGAGERGGHARALPAVVRVRDDRRLRRDPLRRPGVERLRALRRARHVDRPRRAGGRAAHARDASHAPQGPPCASSSWARRARSA